MRAVSVLSGDPRSFALLAVFVFLFGGPARAADWTEDAELRGSLKKFADSIYLYESGQHNQVISNLTMLINKLEKKTRVSKPASTSTDAHTMPVLRGSPLDMINQIGKASVSEKGAPSADALVIPLLRGNTRDGEINKQLLAEALDLRGMSYFILKQTKQSLTDLNRAASTADENAYIHCDLGTVLSKSKKPKEAIVELSRAIKTNPRLREAYFMRANCYQQMGKGSQSQSDLRRSKTLMSEEQNKIDDLNEKIEELNKDGKFEDAFESSRQLLRLMPRDSLALSTYAQQLIAANRFKPALLYATLAIALDPQNAYGYRVRSSIYAGLQMQKPELEDANKAFELEPRSMETLNSRAIASLDNDKPAQALRDINIILKKNPEYADGYINRSAAYLRLEDYEKAIKDAKKAIALKPSSPYGYQCLGAALRRKGEAKEARATLDQSFRYAKEASPDSMAMAHFNLACLFAKLGDPAASQQHINDALKLAPTLPRVLLRRATYDAGFGKQDPAFAITAKPTARKGTTQVTQLKRSKPAVSDSQTKVSTPAQTIYKISFPDLEDCVFLTSHTIRVSPDKGDAYYLRGLAYLCQSKQREAQADFKKCATLKADTAILQNAKTLVQMCGEKETARSASEIKALIDKYVPGT